MMATVIVIGAGLGGMFVMRVCVHAFTLDSRRSRGIGRWYRTHRASVPPCAGGLGTACAHMPSFARYAERIARHRLEVIVSQRPHPNPSSRLSGLFRQRIADGSAPDQSSAPRTRYMVNGQLTPAPRDVSSAESLEFAEAAPGRMALSIFPKPSDAEIDSLAKAWKLHPVLVEDLQHGGQRPKLERYGDVLFLVVRSARYLDEAEDVDFAEFHVLVRPHAIAVLCKDGLWIDGEDSSSLPENSRDTVARGDATLLDDGRLLELGPEAVLYRLLTGLTPDPADERRAPDDATRNARTRDRPLPRNDDMTDTPLSPELETIVAAARRTARFFQGSGRHLGWPCTMGN